MRRRTKKPGFGEAPIVRIFVSSTFRDMMEERDLLVTRVFPRLERKLLDHGHDLEVLDLRWGVPQDRGDDDLVIRRCRERIDDARPFFVGLLGARYGTRVSRLGGSGTHSVTEDEILHGVFRAPEDRLGSVFFLRSFEDSISVPADRQRDYAESIETDREAILRLRARVRTSGARCHDYRARWDHARKELAPESGFEEEASSVLWEEIRAVLGLPQSPASLDWRVRVSRTQAVAVTRSIRRTWHSPIDASAIARTLGRTPGGCLTLVGSDSELVAATALAAARVRARHGEVVVPIDGRHWNVESDPSVLLDYLRHELVAHGCLPEGAGGVSRIPAGLVDHLQRFARSLRRPATLVIGALGSLLPPGYLATGSWRPDLRGTKLRLLAYDVDPGGSPTRSVAALTRAGVARAIRLAVAADGRELEQRRIRSIAGCEAMRSSRNVRILAEVLRVASTPSSVEEGIEAMLPSRREAEAQSSATLTRRLLAHGLQGLVRQYGAPSVASVLPFVATSRQGLRDSDLATLGSETSADRAVSIGRRLRRMLDVSEGRLRVASEVPAGAAWSDPSRLAVRDCIERFACDATGLTSLRQLHAFVADRYSRLPSLEVGVRDLIWHLVQAADARSLGAALRRCADMEQLAAWARVAPATEMDADIRALSEVVRRNANVEIPPELPTPDAIRRFVRVAYAMLRDPALDPWQTAALEGLASASTASSRTRFRGVALLREPILSRDSCLGALPSVTRVRLRGSSGKLLVEHRGLLETFDPKTFDLHIASAAEWRAIAPEFRSVRTSPRRRGSVRKLVAGRSGDMTVELGAGEPIIRSKRRARAIPVSADHVAAAVGTDVACTLLDDSERLICWNLRGSLPGVPSHALAVTELAAPIGADADQALRSWGLDGRSLCHALNGTISEVAPAHAGTIWRAACVGCDDVVASDRGLVVLQTGRRIRSGPVSDFGFNSDGTLVAIASESDLRHVEVVVAASGARLRRIALPRGLRHAFRAIRWVGLEMLAIGMMEPEGPGGAIGCFDVHAGRWIWINTLPFAEGESAVLAVETASVGEGTVAALVHLASIVSLHSARDGAVRHSLRIHDSGALIHAISMDPDGTSLAVIDRSGFCEVWDLRPDPSLRVRFVMPVGALTAFSRVDGGIVVGTEGGRVLRLDVQASGARPRLPSPP